MIFIYTLSDPDSTNIRYVGMSRSVVRRWRSHLRVYRSQKNPRTYRETWLAGLKAADTPPMLRIVAVAQQDADAGELERWWIQFYKSRGYQLTNLTEGGGNPRYWDDEQRRIHAESRKGKSYFSQLNKARIGQQLSPEHVRNMSVAVTGKKKNLSPEARQAQSDRNRLMLANPVHRAKMLEAKLKSEPLRIERVRAAAVARRGVPLSEEHKRKVSEGVRRSQTAEYRQKMSEIKKGKLAHPMTKEMKAKISQSLKDKFARGDLADALARRKQTNTAKGQNNNGQKRDVAA